MLTNPNLYLSLPCTAALLVAASIGGLAGPALAQPAVASEVASAVTPEAASATARQLQWLWSTPSQRVLLAERIGEDGARAFARANGWFAMVDGTQSMLRQGFDQVYRTADDLIIVVEAKGGGSPLGHAYGHQQGTPEWAVRASERTIRSPRASAAERQAAEAILKAARDGRLRTAVIRSTHVLGEPMAATLKSMSGTTDEAARLASEALDDLFSRGLLTLDDAAKIVTISTDDAARGAGLAGGGRVIARVVIPLAVAIDGGLRIYEATEVEDQYAAGQITQEERELAHAENAAGMAGGWALAFAGAKVGAMGGGALGSCVMPGPGTAIGAVVGGVAGGVGGYFGGEATAKAAANWAVRQVHATGHTLSEVASAATGTTADAADAAGDAVIEAWHWTRQSAGDAWHWVFGD